MLDVIIIDNRTLCMHYAIICFIFTRWSSIDKEFHGPDKFSGLTSNFNKQTINRTYNYLPTA